MSRRPPVSVFLPFLTSVLLIAGLYVYHWVSTSKQSRYYDERAFRVLAILGRAFAETTEGLRTVLGASTAQVAYEPGDAARDAAKFVERPGTVAAAGERDRAETIASMEAYLKDVLPAYRMQEFQIEPFPMSTRDGVLRFWPLPRTSAFSMRVRYAPAAAAHGSPSTLPECAGAPSICATVDLAPMLDRLFDKLGDDFFEDVVIADAAGKVWYQQNPKDNWIVDLAPLLSTAGQGRPPPAGAKSAGSEAGAAESQAGESGKPAAKEPSGNGRAPRVNFNMAGDVELAGSRHRLYLTPLPVHLPDGAALAPAVIAGFYRTDGDARDDAGAPHTFVIWSTLAVLITFTLLWPVLSFFNMGPKARMQRRQVCWLVASILVSAALLTLLALNISFRVSERARTNVELKRLADGITKNFKDEVLAAVRLLDGADPKPFLAIPVSGAQRPTLDETSRPSMRQQTRALDPLPIAGVRNTPKLDAHTYPYFTYMFWVDPAGWQLLKLTVPERGTPQTQVDKDPYFLDIKNGDLSRLPDPSEPGKSYALRMEPVLSPNTHGFFTIFAMPAPTPYAAKVLAAKLESLVDPVMPPGFGFAVVDSAGHVKYHANSARNLQENFLTETQNDRALQALLSHNLEGSLSINYMGRPHAAVIQPFTDLTRTPLSLIVFRDATPSGTVNASIVLVFALLMIAWTFPFLLIAPFYMRKREYPLAAIWPCLRHRQSYAHLLVAQSAVLMVFALTYSRCGPFACAIAWPVLLAYAGVAYPLLQFRWRSERLIVASRVVLIAALLAFSFGSWAIVVPIAFAAASLPVVAARIETAVAELDLQHLYASMALTSLAVLMVAPACVFFKFAHDSIQRLEVARQEKRAVDAFRDRTRRIDAQTRDLRAPTLACQRHWATLDRYDRLLEVTPEEPERPLRFTALEASLPEFFALFPPNMLGAELQRIALDGVRDARPWTVTRTTLTYEPPEGGGELPTVTRRVQLWSGLRFWTTIGLVLVLVCLYLWFAFVARIVFHLDVQRVPKLDKWNPNTLPADNMLVLGQPRTGRRSAINALRDVQMLDLAERSAADDWGKVPIKGDCVCLFYFDFDLDNAATNNKKLQLLERLLYVRRVRVILLSSVDPMYFLAYRHKREHDDSGAPSAAPSQLERWAAVLNQFRKVQLRCKRSPLIDERNRTYTGDDATRAKKFLRDECKMHIALRGIGNDILSKASKSVPDTPVLVERMLDQSDSYYRLLWTGCTANERLVLFQLARDGWANPLNAAAIQQLQRRGLVRRKPALRIMNDSFRRFVLKSQYPAEVARWESEESASMWRAIRRSLVVCGVVFAAWHVYAYPDVMTTMVTILGGVAALFGILMRLLGDLRPASVVATSVRADS